MNQFCFQDKATEQDGVVTFYLLYCEKHHRSSTTRRKPLTFDWIFCQEVLNQGIYADSS